ncbi:MAG: glycoside hydrolase family 9 protein [Polyangiaceae bacterium]|nr:glycoside hydrolase family 9 protein [Polyangiaceae bacterium]
MVTSTLTRRLRETGPVVASLLLLLTACDPGVNCPEGQRLEGHQCVEPAVVFLNTVGFLPERVKQATVLASVDTFEVRRAGDDQVVYEGQLSKRRMDDDTGQKVRIADFSELTEPGRYVVTVADLRPSDEFRIDDDLYRRPLEASLLGFYGQRCGRELSFEYDDETYSHAACHEDDASLELVADQQGTRDGTSGWHDAGDYGKYTVNGAFSLAFLLDAWQHFGDAAFADVEHIPDYAGGLPSVLDEARYEIEWLLKMQFDDGTVSHQIRPLNYEPAIMPDRDGAQRFFSTASTEATASFAAVMALAARVVEPLDADLSARCLKAARSSFEWLETHPDTKLTANHEAWPNATYATPSFDDVLWAKTELWATTGDEELLKDIESTLARFSVGDTWDWSDATNLALFTYALSESDARSTTTVDATRQSVLASANRIVDAAQSSGFGRGLSSYTYNWGSNGVVARSCMNLAVAHRLAGDGAYLDACVHQLDYLLGRNVFGRSMVTGVGRRPPLHPHHRPSQALGRAWPGLLVGGPNASSTDNPNLYDGIRPGQAWFDRAEDYYTNEIAINWNAALVYALAFVRSVGR